MAIANVGDLRSSLEEKSKNLRVKSAKLIAEATALNEEATALTEASWDADVYDHRVVKPIAEERDKLKSQVDELESKITAVFAHLGAADMGADAFLKHCHSYAELQSRVEELEDQAPRWRPTSEEPERHGTYLCTGPDGITLAGWSMDGWAWSDPDVFSIDHWMPILAPNRPKAAESAAPGGNDAV